jgi:hypothetical protein
MMYGSALNHIIAPVKESRKPKVTLAAPKPRQPAQIISSLFTSNPKVEQKPTEFAPKVQSKQGAHSPTLQLSSASASIPLILTTLKHK